jgi:hypothetical protein
MDSMYSDGPEDAAPTPAKPDAAPDDKQEGEGQTALVPMALCPSMKPGDEMVVKIDKVLDDQYQISYSPEPKKEEAGEGEMPPEKPMMSGGGDSDYD